MGTRIKDAALIGSLSEGYKIPVSDGSNQPKTASVGQIGEFVNQKYGVEQKLSELGSEVEWLVSVNVYDDIPDNRNLYDKSSIKSGYIINDGDVYTEVENKYYAITDYLPYNSDRIWEFESCTTGNYFDRGRVAFFSEKNESSYLGVKYLPRNNEYNTLTGDFSEAKFVRFTLRLIAANDINDFKYIRKPIDTGKILGDVIELNKTLNRINQNVLDYTHVKICAIGDSFTALGYDTNRGFMYFGSLFLGVDKNSQIKNYGIGGACIALNSSNDSNSNTMVNRYSEMEECDIFTIMGGWNDTVAPYNNWDDKLGSPETKTDKTTIFGAISNIIEGYKAKYPYSNAIPVIMTYPHTYGEENKRKLNQCLRDVASYYNAPIIDFEKMCGYFKGLNYNVERPNILSDYLQNWISGKRPHYNGSSAILEDSSWGYIPDYIPRPAQAKILAQPVNSNLHQYEYKNGEYIWLTRTDNAEAILLDNCTHIRFAYFENKKSGAVVTVEDGTFTNFNDIHPNLLGFKKMATVWAEKMKELLFPKI